MMCHSEKRLIDANALKKEAWPERYTGEGIIYVEDVDKAPTVDAVEVVHGRWEWYREENCVICSECKDVHYLGTYHQYSKNYCPNCGAKMDGERKDNG